MSLNGAVEIYIEQREKDFPEFLKNTNGKGPLVSVQDYFTDLLIKIKNLSGNERLERLDQIFSFMLSNWSNIEAVVSEPFSSLVLINVLDQVKDMGEMGSVVASGLIHRNFDKVYSILSRDLGSLISQLSVEEVDANNFPKIYELVAAFKQVHHFLSRELWATPLLTEEVVKLAQEIANPGLKNKREELVELIGTRIENLEEEQPKKVYEAAKIPKPTEEMISAKDELEEIRQALGTAQVVVYKLNSSPDGRFVHYLGQKQDGNYISFSTYEDRITLPRLGSETLYNTLIPSSPLVVKALSQKDNLKEVALEIVGGGIWEEDYTPNMVRLGLDPELDYNYDFTTPIEVGDVKKGIIAKVRDSKGNLYVLKFTGSLPLNPGGGTHLPDSVLELCVSAEPVLSEEEAYKKIFGTES